MFWHNLKVDKKWSSNFALKFRQEGVILEQERILWQTKKKTQKFKSVVEIDFCQATFEKSRLEIDVPTYVE